MITIRIYEKGNGSIRMKMGGHAGTAPIGEDLVCAAATQGAYTVAQTVQDYADMGLLQCPPRIEVGRGKCAIIATPKKEYYENVKNSFWTVQRGLEMLAGNYPEHVQVTERI